MQALEWGCVDSLTQDCISVLLKHHLSKAKERVFEMVLDALILLRLHSEQSDEWQALTVTVGFVFIG
jgi:hypothetical protein